GAPSPAGETPLGRPPGCRARPASVHESGAPGAPSGSPPCSRATARRPLARPDSRAAPAPPTAGTASPPPPAARWCRRSALLGRRRGRAPEEPLLDDVVRRLPAGTELHVVRPREIPPEPVELRLRSHALGKPLPGQRHGH